MKQSLHLQYFAILREQSGTSEETIVSAAATPLALYTELQETHGFTLPADNIRVAINEQFVEMNAVLKDGDHIVFIPPVAGG